MRVSGPENHIVEQAVGARQAARALADQLIAQWPEDRPFNARYLIETHAELKCHKSIALDLAYEEYCRRCETGEEPAPSDFAQRFPSLQHSLRKQLEVHQFLHGNPSLLENLGPPQWPQPKDEFLGFQLLEELGRGGLSRVFLAEEPELGNRQVVVKLCLSGAREAHTLGQLGHPRVVPVYSVRTDSDTGLTVICMPYLSRATLHDVLDAAFENGSPTPSSRIIGKAVDDLHEHAEMPEQQDRRAGTKRSESYVNGILRIAVQLAEGLAFTHRRGILHCDIKPSNILLTPDGRSLLLDFNLSREVSAEFQLGGTLPYMAPEQLRVVVGDRPQGRAAIGPHTDLFSLGVTVYELLTGRLPFGCLPRGASPMEAAAQLLKHQSRGPAPAGRFNRELDRPLARLIERCLATDPKRRPASATALLRELRRHLSAHRRTLRWARSHPRGAIGAAVPVLAAPVFLAWGFSTVSTGGPDPVGPDGALHGVGERGRAVDQAAGPRPREELTPEELFARARSRLAADDLDMAEEDLEFLETLTDDGRVAAALAYCWNLQEKNDSKAIEYYQRAIRQGVASAGVWNNLGYCCERTGRFEEAEQHLKEALRHDPELGQAHRNLAIVQHRQASRTRTIPGLGSKRTSLELAKSAATHMDRAIELGPRSADLFLKAAWVYGLASELLADADSPNAGQYRTMALQACEEAVARHIDPAQLQSVTAYLPELNDSQRFQKLLNRPVPNAAPPKPVSVVRPLLSISDPVRLPARERAFQSGE